MSFSSLTIGKIKITGIRDGYFYLDGGAMFGVVPRVLWEKKFKPDKQNRIRLGLNSLLIQTPQHQILIETGIGENLPQKYQRFYSVERNPGLVENLKREEVQPEDIDFVINTHLHFDHCGGNTISENENEYRPVFPKATYIIQKGEWNCALNPSSSRDKPSYLGQNFIPLKEKARLKLVEGNQVICPGVEVVFVPGHTAHHQCVKITEGDTTVFFLGDLVPTSGHIPLSYIMSYDLFPLQTLESKKKYYRLAMAEEWILAFNHDPDLFFGKVGEERGKFVFLPLK